VELAKFNVKKLNEVEQRTLHAIYSSYDFGLVLKASEYYEFGTTSKFSSYFALGFTRFSSGELFLFSKHC
jgi:hypothetical protein